MSMYPYLDDKEFLIQISTQREQEHYVRIIMLDWNDNEIENGEIQGLVTGGNISVNGNSALRRTGSLSCIVDGIHLQADITNIKNLIAINKRARIEIGLANHTPDYPEHPIIWFPQGVFILSGASVQHTAQGVTISTNLKDKMCLLNGECGGMFSRAMVHTPIYVYNNDSATPIKQHVLFRALIASLVQEYSGLSADKIHIRIADTDPEDGYPMPQRKDCATSEAFNAAIKAWEQAAYNKINQIVSWTGKQPLYYYSDGTFSTVSIANKTPTAILQYGDAMGYQRVPFTYPVDKELTSNTGESVVSVLDKIKATLGNFEYFFDINGEFWFQPIANFQNKGLKEDNLATAIQGTLNYGHPLDNLVDNDKDRYITFDFSNLDWVTAVTNSPKYEAIKNDLSITGVRGDNKQVIQYHLIFEDKDNNKLSAPNGATFTKYTDALGVERLKYDANGAIKSWINTDYRTQMYLGYLALEATNSLPTEPEWRLWGKELKEWWPYVMEFTIDGQELKDSFKILKNVFSMHNMNYWFEMVDMSDYNLNVSQIGHRPKSLNNDKVNVIFQTEPPPVFCVVAGRDQKTAEDRAEALEAINSDSSFKFTQVPSSYGNSIAQGIAQNSAYDNMRSMVHSVIQYNEGLNLTILPLYFLEPNTLITVQDNDAGITRPMYYEIKSYSVPLTSNGTMSLSCVRATTLI